MKAIAWSFAFFVVGLAFGVVGVELRAAASLRRLRDAAEEQRASVPAAPVAREALFGETHDGDAEEGYEAAIAVLKADATTPSIVQIVAAAALAAPAALGPTATAYLDAHRAAIDAVRSAAHASRCTEERRIGGQTIDAVKAVTSLVVLAGHDRALAGDARGAAERYLDAARFATDLAGGPTVVSHMLGVGFMRASQQGLERLVEAGRLAPADLEMVAVALDRLPAMGTLMARGLEAERRTHIEYGYGAATSPRLSEFLPGMPGVLLPVRLQIALTWEGRDDLWGDAIAALGIVDPTERGAAVQRVDARMRSSWWGLSFFNLARLYSKSDAAEQRWAALRKSVRARS